MAFKKSPGHARWKDVGRDQHVSLLPCKFGALGGPGAPGLACTCLALQDLLVAWGLEGRVGGMPVPLSSCPFTLSAQVLQQHVGHHR